MAAALTRVVFGQRARLKRWEVKLDLIGGEIVYLQGIRPHMFGCFPGFIIDYTAYTVQLYAFQTQTKTRP